MIRATVIYGAASMLPSMLGFFLLPWYSKHLSTNEYGIIAAMGIFSGVITVFTNLALDRAAFRFYFDEKDEAGRRRVLGTFFIGTVAVAAACACLLILMRPLLVLAYPDIAFYPYYFLTILTVSISVCEGFVMGYFRIAEQPRSYLLMTLLTVLLQAALIVYFVMFRQNGALGQVKALLVSTLLLLPIYLMVAWRAFAFAFDWHKFKEGLSFSWPFIPTLLIAWILNWSDSVFVANYRTMAEVGLYAMAYKISMVFFMATGAFSVAYQPVFFRKANQEDQIAAKQSLYAIIHVASRAFIGFGFLLALFCEDIVHLLLDDQYAKISPVIRIILLSNVLSSIMGISSNLFYLQSKKTALQLYVVGGAAVANLLLNFLLVPEYGMHGAAVATVISMLVLTFMHYHYARNCYFIDIFWWKLGIIIALAAVVVMGFQIYIEEYWFSLPLKILLLMMMLAFMLKNTGFHDAFRRFRLQ